MASWLGHVEVELQSGLWGRVCDRGWTLINARIVCHQLGYKYAIGAPIGNVFGDGPRLIAYKEINCVGREGALSHCYHDDQAITCDRSHVASAICSNETTPSVQLRLLSNTGTVSPQEGILQINFANQWGGVCTSGWSLINANVACRQLGRERAIISVGVARNNDNIVWLTGVRCHGNESSLAQCSHNGWGYAEESCYRGNSMSVWIQCYGDGVVSSGTNLPTLSKI